MVILLPAKASKKLFWQTPFFKTDKALAYTMDVFRQETSRKIVKLCFVSFALWTVCGQLAQCCETTYRVIECTFDRKHQGPLTWLKENYFVIGCNFMHELINSIIKMLMPNNTNVFLPSMPFIACQLFLYLIQWLRASNNNSLTRWYYFITCHQIVYTIINDFNCYN